MNPTVPFTLTPQSSTPARSTRTPSWSPKRSEIKRLYRKEKVRLFPEFRSAAPSEGATVIKFVCATAGAHRLNLTAAAATHATAGSDRQGAAAAHGRCKLRSSNRRRINQLCLQLKWSCFIYLLTHLWSFITFQQFSNVSIIFVQEFLLVFSPHFHL